MCLARDGVGGGALSILWEHVLDFRPGSGGVDWCYVCLRGESGFSVKRAGTGICILFLADTCAF